MLTHATSQKDTQLATLVDTGNTTIHALASQDTALQQAVRLLPGTLSTARRTFGDLTSFANQLTPVANNLVPVVHSLPTTLADTRTLVRASALIPVGKVRSFESAILPLTGVVNQAAKGLRIDLPRLTTSFKALEYVTNEFAYAPSAGNPGMLYWFAWFAHNVDSFVGNHDANGSAWRALLLTSCSSLGTLNPTLHTLLTTTLGTFGC